MVGDTKDFDDCLIHVYATKEQAERDLERVQKGEYNEQEKMLHTFEKHTNIRIEPTKPEDEWWNDPFLAN
jgi:hypothetical protein